MERATRGERREARGEKLEVLVYESLTGGPLEDRFSAGQRLESLTREGAAMLRAIVADFARCGECDVVCLLAGGDNELLSGLDARVDVIEDVPSRGAAFDRQAAAAAWTLVIAPEIGGELSVVAQRVESVGGRLLGPSSLFIALASDKHRTAERLRAGGIPSPGGRVYESSSSTKGVQFPAVAKPLDGAGSVGVTLLNDKHDAIVTLTKSRVPLRIETFHAGRPISVAVLCSADGELWPLPACEQILSTDGQFTYLGGRTPLAPELNRRAQSLAVAAIQSFPTAIGYVGVDLVLGDDPAGTDDVVIEINPRLTTSYVGLRQLAACNLAQAILRAASGQSPELRFHDAQLEFDASGRV